jgi:hypothetical protein
VVYYVRGSESGGLEVVEVNFLFFIFYFKINLF